MAEAKETAVREAVEVAMAEVLTAVGMAGAVREAAVMVAVRAAAETESPHGQRC